MQKPLSTFVSELREKIGLSQGGLAKKCNLDVSEIENIENGTDLFLSSTTRQKLSKGLRVSLDLIKKHERKESFELVDDKTIDELKDKILIGEQVYCPKCGEILTTRIAKMYDLEDNLMLHPKARCERCPFQIK